MKPKNEVDGDSKTELTISKLRSYTGFENFSDAEAELAIQNIKRLAKILFGMYQRDQTTGNARH